jgi:hypothetical protein
MLTLRFPFVEPRQLRPLPGSAHRSGTLGDHVKATHGLGLDRGRHAVIWLLPNAMEFCAAIDPARPTTTRTTGVPVRPAAESAVGLVVLTMLPSSLLHQSSTAVPVHGF